MSKTSPAIDKTLFSSMICFFAGLVLWLGSLLFFGIGVAMIIFKILPTKDLAGTLNAAILHRLNMMELIGVTLIGTSIALLWQRVGKRVLMLPLGILLAMVCLWCVYALGITSEMNALRSLINSFDAPSTASLPLIQQFRGLHGWYSRCVSANIVLGTALFLLQVRFYLRLAQHS
jgi:hypothetical protein